MLIAFKGAFKERGESDAKAAAAAAQAMKGLEKAELRMPQDRRSRLTGLSGASDVPPLERHISETNRCFGIGQAAGEAGRR